MSTPAQSAWSAAARHKRRGSAMVVVFVLALIAVGCVFLLWEVTKKYDKDSALRVKEANTIHAVSEVVDWVKARRDYRFYFYIGTQTWTWTDDKNNNEVADYDEGTVWQPTSEFDDNGNGIPDFGEKGVTPVKWGDSEVFVWTRLLEGESGKGTFQYICGARTLHTLPDGKTTYYVQEMADLRRKWRQNTAEIDAALMLQVNDTFKQADMVVDTSLDGTGSAGDKVSGLDHGLDNQLNGSGNDKYAISLNDGFALGLTVNGGATISGENDPNTGKPINEDRPSSEDALDALISAVEDMTPTPIVLGSQGVKLDNEDGTYGTADNWKVTRIDASAGGSISMSSQTTGYGILLIEYDNLSDIDVKLSGGAGWTGIVLLVAKNSGTVPSNGGLDISGSPGKEVRMLGSTIVYAKNADGGNSKMSGAVKISGTPTVNYSAEAVAKALQPIPPTDKMNFRLLTVEESHPNNKVHGTLTTDADGNTLKMASNNGFNPIMTTTTTTTTTTGTQTTDTTGTTTTDTTGTTTTDTTGTTTGTTTSPGNSGSTKGASKKP